MAAPKTVLTYPLNGTERNFTIPFEYLARKFVAITLIGKTRRTLVLNSEYRFTTKNTITTTAAWGPAQGYDSIEVRRVTSATERLVDFSDGSILRAYDLNTAQVQSLHIAEEARDLTADTIGVNNNGDLDARGRKIVNVADAVADGDAVNLRQQKTWAGSALNQAQASAASATASEVSRQASATSAAASATSAIQSANSAAASQASRLAAEQANTNANSAYQSASQKAADSATSATASEQSRQQSAQQASLSASSATAASASKDAAKLSEVSAAQSAVLATTGLASFGAVPVGAIVMLPCNGVLAGFLWCNGATFDKDTYPELFALLGTNVLPDFRDRYLKGAGTEPVGSRGASAMPAHSHVVPAHTHSAWTDAQGDHAHGASAWTDAQGSHAHSFTTINTGGTVGNVGFASTAGRDGPRYGASTDWAGAHAHNVGVSIAAAGSHAHNVGVAAAAAMNTTAAGTGAKVETDRLVVHFFIKASPVPAANTVESLQARLKALEEKMT